MLITLNSLNKAKKAAKKLRENADADTIHDFRVAIRRLRTYLQSFKDHLGKAAAKKFRRKLRDIAHKTTPARESDVAAQWLSTLKGPAARWLTYNIRRNKNSFKCSDWDDLAHEFLQIAKKIENRLSSQSLQESDSEFGKELRKLLSDHTRRFHTERSAILSSHDEALVHRARITTKKFRYLLEPVRNEVPRGPEKSRAAENVQAVLGDLHDMHVLEHEIQSRYLDIDRKNSSAASVQKLERGLMAIDKKIHQRENRLFDRFKSMRVY